jgi:predicted DCC family thiol-disulfide oxidoreductase YuxK
VRVAVTGGTGFTKRHEQPHASGDAHHAVLVFDGDCGFCTSAARWAESRFRHGERAEAWQLLGESALASFGLSARDVQEAAWWVDGAGARERGHRAAGRALQAGGGWRRVVGWFALNPPTSWIAAGAYRLVVRFRYRLPGGTPACRLASNRRAASQGAEQTTPYDSSSLRAVGDVAR